MGADLVIIGGGPAGLATAIHAARHGLTAVLLEKRSLPLDKACGEGLMPAGVATLVAMGVQVPEVERAPYIGIRYIEGDRVAEGRFQRAVGWGIRRTVLVDRMAARARELGVDLRYGCNAKWWRPTPSGVLVETDASPVAGAVLVGADGLHSRVRRAAGLDLHWRGPRRFGVRRHFRICPWAPFVEVYWGDGAEAYVTPVGPERVGVAFLWSGSGRSFDEFLAAFPRLGRQLAGAATETEPLGAGPFRQGVGRRYAGNIVLIGDAAGYLDPITGEGLALAFDSAQMLAEIIARGQPLAAYDQAYQRISRRYYLVTRMVLAMTRWPGLRREVIAAFSRSPRLFERVLAATIGAPAS